MRTVEEEALELAKLIGSARPRRHAGYGIEGWQADTLEPDPEPTPLWVHLVAMAAVLLAALLWFQVFKAIDRPPAVDPAGGAAEEATAHGSGSNPREPSSADCLLCWLDGFSGKGAGR